MTELQEYLLDYYGLCRLGNDCNCIQPIKRTSPIETPEWIGRMCSNWMPAGAIDYEQLNLVHEVFQEEKTRTEDIH